MDRRKAFGQFQPFKSWGQACDLCDFQSTNHTGKFYVNQVRLNWYWLRILIPVK